VSIIGKVVKILQTALGVPLDEIGRQTGVIKRQRKFSGSTLLKTIVLTLLKYPNAKPDQFVATAAQLGVLVSPQALEKRFSPQLVPFLRASLEHLLEQTISASPAMIPLLKRFTAAEVGDSSMVTLPDEYAEEFPGCGGTSGSGKAAVKIQVRWDLLSGKLSKLVVEPGRCSDGQNEAAEDDLKPGSLTIRDLGYFSLKRFQTLGANGVYWISRWQQGTLVFDPEGQPLELLGHLRSNHGKGPIDMPILLGTAERLPCRLIALRVPQEVANRRRQTAYEKARKHGRVPTQEHLAWCEWTILVTNCPEDLLSWKEVIVLYRARWQIELMFKLWKSHNHLAAYRQTWSAVERMAMFWAKLIGVVLQHWLLLTSTWSNHRRSLWKAAQVISEWIATLTVVLDDEDRLIDTLTKMSTAVAAVANQKLQKKRPSSFQLLLNPELLDWVC
jgi:Transposase DDE domain